MNPLKPLRLAVAALRDEVNKQAPDEAVIQMRIEQVVAEGERLGLTHDEADREASKRDACTTPGRQF